MEYRNNGFKETDHDGVKEVILKISGNNVFGDLKFESGTHRVQRVPLTESGGRIHTSAELLQYCLRHQM